MSVERINSEESEGLFTDFVDEQLSDLVEQIINEGDTVRGAGDSSDIIVEMDDISPPSFTYGEGQAGAGGQGAGEPGSDKGRLRFNLPFERFMELAARRLSLPDLTKEGKGRIKQISYQFKTFGPTGVVMDKRRTFKRAFKSSIGTAEYRPDQDRYNISIRRRDRRYKQSERVERPRYRAACFYIGDISYSTWGERLELEKRLLNFVHHWLDYNYGVGNVEHRYFVHDAQAYEVTADEFYTAGNIGGTEAAMAFDLLARVACNEYDPAITNLYAFYVGDGELMRRDAAEVVRIVAEQLHSALNRLCVLEIKPSASSCLADHVTREFTNDRVVKGLVVQRKEDIIDTIVKMFGGQNA